MLKYGFDPSFPKSVIREINQLHPILAFYQDQDIPDLRSLLWSSIDNIDSMDLDQIEYCERGPDGIIRVQIAIADVDEFVHPKSAVDRHAAHNGTSVYTGIETFPLLPDKLSKGISSLLPKQDCMAVVIRYDILSDGSIRPGVISRGIVSNKAKLVYEEVGSWLEGSDPIPSELQEIGGLKEQIELQNEAAERLRKQRMDHGALDLDTLEAHVQIQDGKVMDLILQKPNPARRIIEEFMVAANQTMVAFLEHAGYPMIHRVVRIPKYWDKIVTLAGEYHEHLPKKPDSDALSEFLKRRKISDPDRFPDLSLTVVKLMGAGEYVAYIPGKEPVGHFALAVTHYTHGTAPNRRYVDLIIQRLIKSVICNQKNPYTLKELDESAVWLTDREMGSKKVERFMRKAAAAVLLQDKIGVIFEGFITGASIKGTYIRLLDIPAEGRVVHGESGLSVGRKIRVRLIKTDPYNGFIDFERIR